MGISFIKLIEDRVSFIMNCEISRGAVGGFLGDGDAAGKVQSPVGIR